MKTCTEWTTLYGGRRANEELLQNSSSSEFRRLPFTHCSLSLQPFSHPYCNTNGIIYDLSNIVPFLQKYGIDPISGQKTDIKSLIKLNFHKNSEGKYHCPVLYKVFTQNSHIIAIKTTGNVFSYEAIEQLNIKAKNFKDLLTDEPFTKKDMITILDPRNLEKFNVSDFYHIKNQLRLSEDNETDSKMNLRFINNETRDTLQELSQIQDNNNDKKETNEKNKPIVKADKFNAAHYSTGAVAAAFTSTTFDPMCSKLEPAIIHEDLVKYSKVKKKGYVRLVTNLGQLNIELYCDQTPKTCDNFIRLCKQDYYNGTIFHRLIKHFMIQGGDPTGTGTGGESAFGEPFEDEFRPQYSHEGRGVLSMANSGPNTNKSQFFITFRSCKHLDKKHTIFGRLVGGLEVLDLMERIKTDEKDKPLEDIKVLRTIVFVDPFQEIDDEINTERERMSKEKRMEGMTSNDNNSSNARTKPIRTGIGSYINLDSYKKSNKSDDTSPAVKKQKLSENTGFGNFNNW